MWIHDSGDAQYVFLLWQKEMRELSAGIYNLLKKNEQHTVPVDRFTDWRISVKKWKT